MALPVDVNYSDPNVRVFTRGIRESVKQLEAAGAEVEDLKASFRKLGQIVLRDIHPPVKSGRLQKSIRLSATKNSSKIRAGGAKVPYAARIEYGVVLGSNRKNAFEGKGKQRKQVQEITHRIEGHFFMKKAIQRNRNKVVREMAQEIRRLFQQHDLGDPPIKISGYVANANYVHPK